MARSEGLSQWQQTVSSHMSHLTNPQATVLALWSFGMVLAQSCGLTSVAATLAPLLGKQDATVRQHLRDWCYEAPRKAGAKRGTKRKALDVTTCFAPLLGWVLAWWPPTERRLALAMDTSTLGQRFTVLSVSLLYRGCAIPIAWVVVSAPGKGSWRPHWEALYTYLTDVVPADWTVIVLADRGLYARWLYRQIQKLGWHPFLRINQGGNYRRQGHARFRPLAQAVRPNGRSWSGYVTCFSSQGAQLECTLLARWDAEPTGSVADCDRSGAGSCGCGLVWAAPHDRMWLQGHQTGRLALGTDQDDRAGARDTAVAGDSGGDAVGGERGWAG